MVVSKLVLVTRSFAMGLKLGGGIAAENFFTIKPFDNNTGRGFSLFCFVLDNTTMVNAHSTVAFLPHFRD